MAVPVSPAGGPPSAAVDQAIQQACAAYRIPLWFGYSVVGRESGFNPSRYNPNGGYGLTQLTGSWMNGLPAAYSSTPGDSVQNEYCGADVSHFWVAPPSAGSNLNYWFNALPNMQRACSIWAAMFNASKVARGFNDNETWRHVAYCWNHGYDCGHFNGYSPGMSDPYLTGSGNGYDNDVAVYRPYVEGLVGVWQGPPDPTGSSGGGGGGGGTVAVASFTVPSNQGQAPFTVTPTFTGSAPSGSAFDWDWGDGSPHATAQSPGAHQYSQPGTY